MNFEDCIFEVIENDCCHIKTNNINLAIHKFLLITKNHLLFLTKNNMTSNKLNDSYYYIKTSKQINDQIIFLTNIIFSFDELTFYSEKREIYEYALSIKSFKSFDKDLLLKSIYDLFIQIMNLVPKIIHFGISEQILCERPKENINSNSCKKSFVPPIENHHSLFEDNFIMCSKNDVKNNESQKTKKKPRKVFADDYNSEILDDIDEKELEKKIDEYKRRFYSELTSFNQMKKDTEEKLLSEDSIADFFIDKYKIYKFMSDNTLINTENNFLIFIELYDILVNKKEIEDCFYYLDDKNKELCLEYIKNNDELF